MRFSLTDTKNYVVELSGVVSLPLPPGPCGGRAPERELQYQRYLAAGVGGLFPFVCTYAKLDRGEAMDRQQGRPMSNTLQSFYFTFFLGVIECGCFE